MWVNQTCTTSTASTWTVWIDDIQTNSSIYYESQRQQLAQLQGMQQQQLAGHYAAQQHALAQYQRQQQRTPTPEEIAEHERRRVELMRERAERAVKEKEAEGRAKAILIRHLKPAQRADLEARGWFLVDGKSGTRYRIKRGSLVGNVEVLAPDGSVRYRLCAHERAGIGCPLDDQLLTQKLYLEHHEEDFLRVANRH